MSESELKIKTMTRDEFKAEAVRRFGPDPDNWKFVCPSCGNVQSPKDFEPYKDQGAEADSCTRVCIGRYAGGRDAFSDGEGPCNYTAYGLIQLAPIRVEADGTSRGDCTPHHCFAFAEVDDA